MNHPKISLATVLVEIGGGSHKMLVAYIVFSVESDIVHADEIRSYLGNHLPPYMLPAKYVMVEDLPLTDVGKIDKKKLSLLSHTDLFFHVDASSDSYTEEKIKSIWKSLLDRKHIDSQKSLFELGANSLLISEACTRINHELQTDLYISDLLTNPSIHKLSQFIEGDIAIESTRDENVVNSVDIAIVGMSCRFPKAENIDEYWQNLCEGLDCLERFSEDTDESFISVRGLLENIDQFDANFFGINPADASILDPQQRVFLECAWQALEHAGISPSKNSDIISVFSGMTDSTYLHENLLRSSWFVDKYDSFQQRIATSIGTLSTQTSYRLNFKGKSVNVNTACSTGLVVVEQACHELISGKSDTVVAGAVSIVVPQRRPYVYKQGSVVSADGCCRPFSKNANGTVFSDGVGVLILKRLDDAIRDKNTIYSVIKGIGCNNDGSDKLGLTAPSVNGQRACIREALNQASLRAEDIGYIETHGTATALGDVIEMKALTSVYREDTQKSAYCAMGSVKANIGHTDVAAGIAGIIKASLCLYHKKIPPLIHFEEANPELSLGDSPFFVNTELLDWGSEQKRFAGVSSFGVGGTNVHLILSSHTEGESKKNNKAIDEELILLSAKSSEALKSKVSQFINLLDHTNDEQRFGNIAYTLQRGREDFNWRQFAVGNNSGEISYQLTNNPVNHFNSAESYSVVFMFGGQGTQHHKMAMNLYKTSSLFRKYMRAGFVIVKRYLGCDLEQIINDSESDKILQTEYAQPAIFIIEYALAKTLMGCGIQPDILIGHSLGEYVAACLAEVISFEDAIALICERGILMSQTKPGAMIAVDCAKSECRQYLKQFSVELALHNSTNNFVFAGSIEDIGLLEELLLKKNKTFKKLKVNHAFHSKLMESVQKPFKEIFVKTKLSPATLPIISNVTGDWLLENEAVDPNYWYKHLRNTVKFTEGIKTILKDQRPIFLEISVGSGLSSFVQNISEGHAMVLHTLPNRHQEVSDKYQVLNAIGNLWSKGKVVDLTPLYKSDKRQLVQLPVYPFQRKRYWVEPEKGFSRSSLRKPILYKPVWSRRPALHYTVNSKDIKNHTWIIFTDEFGLSEQLIGLLKKNEVEPIVIDKNLGSKLSDKSSYIRFLRSIQSEVISPYVIHCSLYKSFDTEILSNKSIEECLGQGFYSILHFVQAYNQIFVDKDLNVILLSSGMYPITGNEKVCPVNSSILGMSKVLMQEIPLVKFKIVDLNPMENPEKNSKAIRHVFSYCINDLWSINKIFCAYRYGYFWSETYAEIKSGHDKTTLVKDNGVYVITGGMGGIALNCCIAITKIVKEPTFVILTRTKIPTDFICKGIIDCKDEVYEKKLELILLMQKDGARFEFYQVDIAKYKHLESIILEVSHNYDKINGLIHTAGVVNNGLAINKSRKDVSKVFSPKILGTYNLAKVFRNIHLDFVVLKSSLSAILGGLQHVDYAAANSCLSAFADSNIFNCEKVISINWNTWRDVGIAAEAKRQGKSTFIGLGDDISSVEGQEIFIQALSCSEPHVAVSKKQISIDEVVYGKDETSSMISDLQFTNHVTSESEIENKISAIWGEHLGINSIGVDENFFSLGGSSLNAINIIHDINAIFDSKLPITSIYEYATVKKLSIEIQNRHLISKSEIVVPLKILKDKSPTPVFFCHPISGLVYCFSELLSCFRLSFSAYGLQDPSINANKLLYTNLKEMANDYLRAIKRVQPTGPYFLVGYSFGGNLMYEVSSLLERSGDRVALLIMLDSWAKTFNGASTKGSFEEQMVQVNNNMPKEIIDLAWNREQLLLNHVPTKSKQNVVLFKAKDLLNNYVANDHPTNYWSGYTHGRIDCIEALGNHNTILESKNNESILNCIKEAINNTKNENIG